MTPKLIRLFAIQVLLTIACPVNGQTLVINELMQSNVDVIMDDLNDFPDSWVELYNNSSIPISLSEYQIGIQVDDNNNPVNAWQLPFNVVLPAHDHLLVYCDKAGEKLQAEMQMKREKGEASDEDVERAKLHTNFRLTSGKGCVVYLFKNNVLDQSASVVDSLEQQPAPNIAYGRVSDGSTTWGYELKPSPGRPNCGGICKHNHILGKPVFSMSVFCDN